ncbi:MAG TPA: hypothetical protein VGJ05_22185 [Fimbriiglobus sp.]
MINVTCEGCGRACEFADYLAGMTMVCKGCTHKIPLPPSKPKPTPVVPTIPPVSKFTPPAPTTQSTTPSVVPRVPTPAEPALNPERAVEKVRALLRTGVGVPECIQRLVAQGLSPEAATAAVDRALEERIRVEPDPLTASERHRFIHRTLSAVLAGIYALLSLRIGGFISICFGLIILLSLASVWFPNEMGSITGRFSPTQSSPGIFVRWCGWFILIVIGIAIVWLGVATAHVR